MIFGSQPSFLFSPPSLRNPPVPPYLGFLHSRCPRRTLRSRVYRRCLRKSTRSHGKFRQRRSGLAASNRKGVTTKECLRCSQRSRRSLGEPCPPAIKQWKRLQRYTGNGDAMLKINNTWADNPTRGIAIGHRNLLHMGSQGAGPLIAASLSILDTCNRPAPGIKVRAYPLDGMPHLLSRQSSLNRLA